MDKPHAATEGARSSMACKLAASVVAAISGATLLVVAARRARGAPAASAVGVSDGLASSDTRGGKPEDEGDGAEQKGRLGL